MTQLLQTRVTNRLPREPRIETLRGTGERSLRPLPEPVELQATAIEKLRQTVKLARAIQPVWARSSLEERTRALRQAARRVLADRELGLRLLQEETGKVGVDSLMSEVLGASDQVEGWVRVVRRALRTRQVRLNPLAFFGKNAGWQLVPRGVVGCITSWNFPVANFYRPVLPALLTGNAVVVKPSEHATKAAAWYLGHLAAALPKHVLQVVDGAAEAGRALIDAGIDACTFTGSEKVGREVLIRCAERMIPASVELGGKDMAIVLRDADLSRTAAGITHWALQNAGQSCSAIEVAVLDVAIADEFVQRLARCWQQLTVAPARQIADVAPLAHVDQLEHVEQQVQAALAQGAKLVCGGRRTGQGFGYEPTILDHCTPQMGVVAEETFGPVLAIVRSEGTEAAVRLVNACRYGLTASIWTRDIQRARRLAERLAVGTVTVNNHSLSGATVELPWSGTRATGTGVANSELGLHVFTRPQSLLVDRAKAPDPFWVPYDDDLMELGTRLIHVQLGDLRAAWKVPLLLRARVRRIRDFYEATR